MDWLSRKQQNVSAVKFWGDGWYNRMLCITEYCIKSAFNNLLLFSCLVKPESFAIPWLTRLLWSWDFPGKNTGLHCHFLLRGIFLMQGLNPRLLHWQADSLPLSHQGSPFNILALFLCLWEKELNFSVSPKRRHWEVLERGFGVWVI